MREFFLRLFSAREGNAEIALFNFWHILYLVLLIGAPLLASFLLKGKAQKTKDRVLKILAYLVPALYIADFFIMPLARTDFTIDVDKLPFHICTLMAFFVPFAQFNERFKPIKDTICCLTLVASLMYLTYPGSAIGDISPWCYKIVQTFLYHGCMLAWAILSLTIGKVKLEFKNLWKCAVGICLVIVWAYFGSVVYSTPDHHYDWFFVTGTTFPFVPTFLMPFVVLVAVFGMCAIIHAIYYYTARYIQKRANSAQTLENVEENKEETTAEQEVAVSNE